MTEPRPRAVLAVVDELVGALGLLGLPLVEVTVVRTLVRQVFGHRVLIVAVHSDLLLGTMRVIDILERQRQNKTKHQKNVNAKD